MQETPRPKQVLKGISRKWPNWWQQVKIFRAEKAKSSLTWPDWCYLPISASVAIATQGAEIKTQEDMIALGLSPSTIAAAAAWRVTQGVYRFDPDLYNSLVNQPMDDNLPCEALHRLPEWCVYIETIPENTDKDHVVGFWAHLEYDDSPAHEELRLVLFWNTGDLLPVSIYIGDWTLEEGLRRYIEEAIKQAAKYGIQIPGSVYNVQDAAALVQLVLYLCADNADMPQVRHPSGRVRMSGQVDVPRQERYWTVGERIGAAIRKYQNESNTEQGNEYIPDSIHARPRPHIRRAHWHHYWTGPRQGERKLILHWLPPIPVGVDENEGPAVIHKVERGD